MAPEGHVKHAIHGRVRIHVPSKKGDPSYFDQVRQKLNQHEATVSVETNHVTGTILVRHEGDLEGIRKFAEDHGLFTLAAATEAAVVLARRVSGHIDSLDDTVIENTRGRMDLNSLMLVGLAGAAAIQILRKNVLPPAFTLIWYGLALVWPGIEPAYKKMESAR